MIGATRGHHLGELPDSPELVEAIRRSHDLGFITILRDDYEGLVELGGVEPSELPAVLPIVQTNPSTF